MEFGLQAEPATDLAHKPERSVNECGDRRLWLSCASACLEQRVLAGATFGYPRQAPYYLTAGDGEDTNTVRVTSFRFLEYVWQRDCVRSERPLG